MDFYFGRCGKDYSWGLASETPIVLFLEDKRGSKFIGLKSLAEAKKYEKNDNAEIYIWSMRTGNWEKAQFIVKADKPSTAIGFKNPN